jgi:pimeloyl-ACP methyl ester carboxylesterase
MYIVANDQQIYYQKIGKGKDLVMLHGWANDVSSFWNVAQELKDDFTVWLIDLPGFGRSEMPKTPFSVSDYAETIFQLLKELKIDKPVILGHSHGGRTTIKLVAQHPEVAEKIILLDSAGIKPKRDGFKFIAYIAAKVFNILFPEIWGLKKLLRHYFYKNIESDYIQAGELKETLRLILEEDLTADIKKIQTETLVLWGENDPTLEASLANGRNMYKLIPKSRFEIIEGAGHHPHIDNPKMFVYWVKDFAK